MGLFSYSGSFSRCLAEEGTARWCPRSGSRHAFCELPASHELVPRPQAGTGSGHQGGRGGLRLPGLGLCAHPVPLGPPSTLLMQGKSGQCPAGAEACWSPISRYGNSPPQEVIQLQVETISRKVLAKFRGDRHDGMIRGEWDVVPWAEASPRAGVGEDLLRPPTCSAAWGQAHADPPIPRGSGAGERV